MNINTIRKGFTLIEVLVLVSIIGILAAVVYANFGDARVEARNKAFQTELAEVRLALELYRAQNNRYPAEGTWENDLVPEFTPSVPQPSDSANSGCTIAYETGLSGSWYKITAVRCHGGDTNITEDSEFARCPSHCETVTPFECSGDTYDALYVTTDAFTKTYAIYSNGGECK